MLRPERVNAKLQNLKIWLLILTLLWPMIHTNEFKLMNTIYLSFNLLENQITIDKLIKINN